MTRDDWGDYLLLVTLMCLLFAREAFLTNSARGLLTIYICLCHPKRKSRHYLIHYVTYAVFVVAAAIKIYLELNPGS